MSHTVYASDEFTIVRENAPLDTVRLDVRDTKTRRMLPCYANIGDNGLVSIDYCGNSMNSIKEMRRRIRMRSNEAKVLAKYIIDDNVPCLQSLDLSSNEIGREGLRALAYMLIDAPLTHLNVAGNNIGVRSAKGLAKAAQKSTTLQCLDLGRSVSEKTAQVVMEMLQGHSTLQSLGDHSVFASFKKSDGQKKKKKKRKERE